MIYVLDACAMIAYLNGEPGDTIVESLLRDPLHTCIAHAVNICEVYYGTIRQSGEPTANKAIRDLMADGVVIRRDLGAAMWKDVGRLKARGGIAIPDCFCIALARRVGGAVVTSDHKEFDPLVPLGLCPILFIR